MKTIFVFNKILHLPPTIKQIYEAEKNEDYKSKESDYKLSRSNPCGCDRL